MVPAAGGRGRAESSLNVVSTLTFRCRRQRFFGEIRNFSDCGLGEYGVAVCVLPSLPCELDLDSHTLVRVLPVDVIAGRS